MGLESLIRRYKELYNSDPIIVRSPGRINLLGEHVDYNDGIVLPAAIDKAIWIALGKSDLEESTIHSIDLEDSFSFKLGEVKPSNLDWPNYTLGAIDQVLKNGFKIENFNAIYYGDIPIGAGLSSSAAIECGFIYALNEMFNLGIEKRQMALMGQLAEHTFVGTKCGIMDQYASLFGKEGQIIKLDCRTIKHTYHEIDLGSNKLLLLDTGVKHSLAESAYNKRREQCEAGVAVMTKKFSKLGSLRDFTMSELSQSKPELDPDVYQKCKFVIEEMGRVEAAIECLHNNKIDELGRLMYETHEGLSKVYEVSCDELDFLIEEARNFNIPGARMMGGGFGGCTLNLVPEDKLDEFVSKASKNYKVKFNIELKSIEVAIKNGTSAEKL